MYIVFKHIHRDYHWSINSSSGKILAVCKFIKCRLIKSFFPQLQHLPSTNVPSKMLTNLPQWICKVNQNLNRWVNYIYILFCYILSPRTYFHLMSMSYLRQDKHFPSTLCRSRDSNPCMSVELHRPGTIDLWARELLKDAALLHYFLS